MNFATIKPLFARLKYQVRESERAVTQLQTNSLFRDIGTSKIKTRVKFDFLKVKSEYEDYLTDL